jgi:vacuolar-type H+-ATPase subunit I/STV1
MDVKKFIKKVKSTLRLVDYKVEGKKKSLKDLIKKLNTRKKSIKKSLETANKKEKKELDEELEIVTCQIKKGKKILHDLYSNNSVK